jgi:hypothetical protein
MKVAALLLATLLLSCMVSAKADCPTTASCAEHGMNGNPTGQYRRDRVCRVLASDREWRYAQMVGEVQLDSFPNEGR